MPNRIRKHFAKDEWKRLQDDYAAGNGSRIEIAARHNVNPGTLPNWMSVDGIAYGSTSKASAPVVLTHEEIDTQVVHDRELLAKDAEIRFLKAKYNSAIRLGLTEDALKDILRDTVEALPVLDPDPPKVPSKTLSSGKHVLVAQVSDIHAGEVVDPAAMYGTGNYNMDVFQQRAGLWVERLLLLTEIKQSRLTIETLQILMDGDMISGIIHDELERTNQVNVVEQVRMVAVTMAIAISQVASRFKETKVSCTKGNHGRIKQKKEAKDSPSWDNIAYEFMAFLLRDHGHIKFEIAPAKFTVTPVLNENILHFHGDGIRSWNGFPWYGADRAIKRMREMLQANNVLFTSVAISHFHVPMTYLMPTGLWLVNGNWKGGDEYVIDQLFTGIAPTQNFSLVHEEHGFVDTSLIYLNGQTPKHAKAFPKLLPSPLAELDF
jgi:transposase-like protein